MDNVLETLTERLTAIKEREDDSCLWRRWLGSPLPLSAWEAWTLLCLVRHRERQQFVANTVVSRLDGSLEALAMAGALGHPERPQQGVVPGNEDWEYFFHGIGCCLTHRQTGEAIDVDFYDDSCDWIDPYFFTCYLESLQKPVFVEERVKVLHPHASSVLIAMRRLKVAGLLEVFEEESRFRVAFDHEALFDSLASIEEHWHLMNVRLSLAAALGDWGFVSTLIDGEDVATTERLHRQSTSGRASLLEANFIAGIDQAESLYALQCLGSNRLDSVLRKSLSGPPSRVTSAALEILAKLEADWSDEVESLLRRINGNGETPQPLVWCACADYLLRRGRTTGIKRKLRRIKSNCLGDAALLSLEFFPDIAVETFHRALRSQIPWNRITAAAALAIVDKSWSRDELAKVLDESGDHEMTCECRSALMTTHSEEAHRKVQDWEARHPRDIEEGPFISMTDHCLRKSDEIINYQMQELHDRVLPLREAAARSPSKRWWH